jgi:ABC-type proline/glycine betaine transport system substrate-binding protein
MNDLPEPTIEELDRASANAAMRMVIYSINPFSPYRALARKWIAEHPEQIAGWLAYAATLE